MPFLLNKAFKALAKYPARVVFTFNFVSMKVNK